VQEKKRKDKMMISFLLSCAHQTHDKINVYIVIIVLYSYPTSYLIMCTKRALKMNNCVHFLKQFKYQNNYFR